MLFLMAYKREAVIQSTFLRPKIRTQALHLKANAYTRMQLSCKNVWTREKGNLRRPFNTNFRICFQTSLPFSAFLIVVNL